MLASDSSKGRAILDRRRNSQNALVFFGGEPMNISYIFGLGVPSQMLGMNAISSRAALQSMTDFFATLWRRPMMMNCDQAHGLYGFSTPTHHRISVSGRPLPKEATCFGIFNGTGEKPLGYFRQRHIRAPRSRADQRERLTFPLLLIMRKAQSASTNLTFAALNVAFCWRTCHG